jgi:hypothetical protein
LIKLLKVLLDTAKKDSFGSIVGVNASYKTLKDK